MVNVRATTPADAAWIRSFLDDRWGGQEQVANGEVYPPGVRGRGRRADRGVCGPPGCGEGGGDRPDRSAATWSWHRDGTGRCLGDRGSRTRLQEAEGDHHQRQPRRPGVLSGPG